MEFVNLTKFTQLGSHRAKTTTSLLTTCCQKLLPGHDELLLCSAMMSSEKTLKVQNGLSYRHISVALHIYLQPFCYPFALLFCDDNIGQGLSSNSLGCVTDRHSIQSLRWTKVDSQLLRVTLAMAFLSLWKWCWEVLDRGLNVVTLELLWILQFITEQFPGPTEKLKKCLDLFVWWDVRRHRVKLVGCMAALLDLSISSLANYLRVWTRWRAT